jgi:hypothetical protein
MRLKRYDFVNKNATLVEDARCQSLVARAAAFARPTDWRGGLSGWPVGESVTGRSLIMDGRKHHVDFGVSRSSEFYRHCQSREVSHSKILHASAHSDDRDSRTCSGDERKFLREAVCCMRRRWACRISLPKTDCNATRLALYGGNFRGTPCVAQRVQQNPTTS